LTIELALSLIATPKAKPKTNSTTGENTASNTNGGNGGGGKPTVEAMEAKQTANAEPKAKKLSDDDDDELEKWPARRILKKLDLNPSEMFEVLKHVYPEDELRELTERLAKHLGYIKDVAKPTPPASVVAPTSAAPTSVGVRRA
jgi:hypothetical protein